MSQKTKAQLVTAIDALYTDCGTECITVAAVNTFEKDKVDSYAGQVIDITKAALTTAITNSEIEIGTRYRITNAAQGVIWVYGVDANVISTNAQLEGTWDGSSLTAGQFGVYDLANDRFVSSGSYTPTITVTGFDSGSSISSLYSVQGRVMTSTHYLEILNPAETVSGVIQITPPTGLTIDDASDLNVLGVIMPRDFTALSQYQEMRVYQAGGQIQLEISFGVAPASFEIYVTAQSKLV